jgi:hypothetical protein
MGSGQLGKFRGGLWVTGEVVCEGQSCGSVDCARDLEAADQLAHVVPVNWLACVRFQGDLQTVAEGRLMVCGHTS